MPGPVKALLGPLIFACLISANLGLVLMEPGTRFGQSNGVIGVGNPSFKHGFFSGHKTYHHDENKPDADQMLSDFVVFMRDLVT